MSWPQSLEIVLLLSGSLSAEFDLTHLGFIDVPGKKHETDFPDTLIKDTLPIIYILCYFISLCVFTSLVLCSKTVTKTNRGDEQGLMQLCCSSSINLHFLEKHRVQAIFEDNVWSKTLHQG